MEPSQQQKPKQQEEQQRQDETCWAKPILPRSAYPAAEQAIVPSSMWPPAQHSRVQRLKEEHGTPSTNHLPQVLQQPLQDGRVTRSSKQKKQQSLPAFEELVSSVTAPAHLPLTRSTRSFQASQEALATFDTPPAQQPPYMADLPSYWQPPTSDPCWPAEDRDPITIPAREIRGRSRTAIPTSKGTKGRNPPVVSQATADSRAAEEDSTRTGSREKYPPSQLSMADHRSYWQPPASTASVPSLSPATVTTRETRSRSRASNPNGKGTKRQECWDPPKPAADSGDAREELTCMASERPPPLKRTRRKR